MLAVVLVTDSTRSDARVGRREILTFGYHRVALLLASKWHPSGRSLHVSYFPVGLTWNMRTQKRQSHIEVPKVVPYERSNFVFAYVLRKEESNLTKTGRKSFVTSKKSVWMRWPALETRYQDVVWSRERDREKAKEKMTNTTRTMRGERREKGGGEGRNTRESIKLLLQNIWPGTVAGSFLFYSG